MEFLAPAGLATPGCTARLTSATTSALAEKGAFWRKASPPASALQTGQALGEHATPC